MRTKIALDSGSDVHQRAKQYAKEAGIRMPRAYAELVEKGLDTDSGGDAE